MSHARSAVLSVVLLGCLALFGCSTGSTGSTGANPAGKSIMETKCIECHTLDRILALKQDKAAWAQTVGAMESNGLVMTVEERNAVIDYLAATYK